MFDIEIPAPEGALSLARIGSALDRLMEALATAPIQLHGQYSDHDNRKVLLVDDVNMARAALAPGAR